MAKPAQHAARSDVAGAYTDAYAQLLTNYLEQQGLQPPEVLGDALPPTVPSNNHGSSGRYPAAQWRLALERASKALNDPLIGLHVGQTITASDLGVLGYVLSACSNLAGLLQRFERYQLLVSDVAPMQTKLEGDTVAIEWQANKALGQLVDDSALAAIVQFARDVTHQNDRRVDVQFLGPEPADIKPYKAFFGGSVLFDQPNTAIRLPLSFLSAEIQQADARLLSMMEQQADALVAELPENDELLQAVRSAVARSAQEGDIGLNQIAARLFISPRTLHRRLEQRGVNFRQLREQTRRRLAENYLTDERLTQSEIAWLLGYSEPSAFSRAFKRWAGQTPGAYRQQAE